MQNRFAHLFSAAFGVTLLFSIFVFAQQGVSLRGQVVDELGAVIPGATITLTPSGDGQARTGTAGATGDFVISNIPAGVYTLTVEFSGFGKYVQNDLQIPQTAPLKITLAVAAVTVVTDIAADSKTVSVEPDQNLSATVLDEDFIKNNLPDNEDDLRSYLQALAGPAAGGVSGGQGQAQIFVDGFSGGRLPPREAILQIRINQNPFTAEFSNPGFGRIEIVTKPGRDQWRGNASFNLRNSALDARNAFALVKPDIHQERYGFNLSGPIIANRMSFFANYEQRGLEGASTVNATTLDGQQVLNAQAPSHSRNAMARADYLLNNRNTLNVSYRFFGSDSDNREFALRFGGGGFGGPGGGGPGGGFGGRGFGGFGGGGSYTLPERGSNSTNNNHTLRLSETFIINSALLLESRLQLQRESSLLTANTTGMAINVLDAFNGGGATCCPSDTRTTGVEWQEYLTWTLKKHTLKFGTQFMRDNVRDYSENNFNGTYTFANLEQYRQAINNPLSARAQQFTINIGDPLLRYSRTEYSWFAQEDWRLRPTLTLSAGLRHEFQSQLNDKNNFAPRVGVAWSPFQDRKTVFRFGGGLFYQRLSGSLYENTLRYDGVTQQSVVILNPLYPDPFAGDPNISITNTVKRTLDPNLKAPYTINFSASVERQLPYGLNGSASYIYARGVHQFRMRNINAPLPGTYDPADPSSAVRPYGDVGNLYQIESSANSKYNGLLFRLDRRMGRTFMLFGNYTLSWTNSDADGAMSLPADNYNLAAEWGRAYTDRRHSIFIGGRVSLPYGFNLSPMITASSGSPFSVTTGFDENGDTTINDRPLGLARNSNLPASLYSLLPNRCVSGCQPGAAQVTLFDYLQTNFPDGVKAENPGAFNVNLSISRSFSFGERKSGGASQGPGGFPGGGRPPMGGPFGGGPFGGGENGRFNVQITAQITNLLNRVNYGSYSGVLGSPYFLQPSSAGGARQFELGVRFGF